MKNLPHTRLKNYEIAYKTENQYFLLVSVAIQVIGPLKIH